MLNVAGINYLCNDLQPLPRRLFLKRLARELRAKPKKFVNYWNIDRAPKQGEKISSYFPGRQLPLSPLPKTKQCSTCTSVYHMQIWWGFTGEGGNCLSEDLNICISIYNFLTLFYSRYFFKICSASVMSNT